ncbi:ABC transporter substrate-binding protein [Mesorhizobium sp. SB112]|uniref:ABC transporter substrate-binding protein n=1 Tax=Mesorhizobium sp. SB112 TaxID=3151853 RepID=UPI0032672A9E
MRSDLHREEFAKKTATEPKTLHALPRSFCLRLVLSLCALLASIQISSAEISLTDITGRNVVLPAPAKRILLMAPAYYTVLSLLSKNSAELVVGVGTAPSGRDAGSEIEMLQDLVEKPRLGSIWAGTFSIEKALELEADLLIAAPPGRGQPSLIEEAFAKAGVPIIYIDFHSDPSKNTAPSIEIVGRAIGEEKKAADFLDFYRERVSRITDRLKAANPARPKLLITSRRPDLPCCFSSASGGVTTYFGGLGVTNIAEGTTPGQPVQLSLEYVIERDPEIFVANDLAVGPHSLFGQPRTLANGVASLEKLSLEPGFRNLSAMHSRRIHAITHNLMISPLNILAFEALATWIHPKLFADIDPQETLDEINRRFLSRPLEGPFWVSLELDADRHSGERP